MKSSENGKMTQRPTTKRDQNTPSEVDQLEKIIQLGQQKAYRQGEYRRELQLQLQQQLYDQRVKSTFVSGAQGFEEPMHHISVKQEPGLLLIPKKRQYPKQQIIDLTESDDEDMDSNDTTAGSSSSPTTQQSTTASSTASSSTNPIQSPSPATAMESSAASSALDVPRHISRLTYGNRTRGANKMVRGGIRSRPSKTIPAAPLPPAKEAPPATKNFWQTRPIEQEKVVGPSVPPEGPEPSSTTGTTSAAVDTNVAAGVTARGDANVEANIAANVDTNAGAITNVGKEDPTAVNPVIQSKATSTPPNPDHSQRYKGPELTIISTQVIWNLLDNAWKHASCNISNIIKLINWWPLTVVIAAHQLNKQQVWLLAYAEYKWWQALEEQWGGFDALPDKDRMPVKRMREVRLKKESKAVRAEAALIANGLEKDVNAVHVLMVVVKKEKVDERVEEKGQEKEKEKAKGKEKGKERQRKQKPAQEGSSKRVRMNDKEAGKEKVDDGLSSDSDEEDDDDE